MTNVPGPQFPLYILGREMESIVPIAFLPENHALAIAIMSYNGKVHFGLLGDYDAMGDLETLRRATSRLPRRAAEGSARRRPPDPGLPPAATAGRKPAAGARAAPRHGRPRRAQAGVGRGPLHGSESPD